MMAETIAVIIGCLECLGNNWNLTQCHDRRDENDPLPHVRVFADGGALENLGDLDERLPRVIVPVRGEPVEVGLVRSRVCITALEARLMDAVGIKSAGHFCVCKCLTRMPAPR